MRTPAEIERDHLRAANERLLRLIDKWRDFNAAVAAHPCPGCKFRNRVMAVAFVLCVVFAVLGAVVR